MIKSSVSCMCLLSLWVTASVYATAQTQCEDWNWIYSHDTERQIYRAAWSGTEFLMTNRLNVPYTQPSDPQWCFSQDAVSWTCTPVQTDYGNLTSNGQIFVVTRGSALYYSSDMTNWQLADVDGPLSGSVTEVVWTGTEFVATGGNRSIFISSDGISWTYHAPIHSPNYTDATRIGSRLFVAGGYGGLAWLADGNDTWQGLYYQDDPIGPFLFSPAGNDDVVLMFASDRYLRLVDDQWQTIFLPDHFSAQQAIWDGNQFLLVGESLVAGLLTSTDGLSWQPRTNMPGRFSTIISNGDRLMITSFEGEILTSDDDGLTWQDRSGGFQLDSSLTGVSGEVSTGQIAVSQGGLFFARNDNKWTLVHDVNIDAQFTGAYGDSRGFIAITQQPHGIWYSQNGINWERRYSTQAGKMLAVTRSDSHILITAEGGELSTSTDGLTWTPQARLQGEYHAAVWTGSRFWLAGNDGRIANSEDGFNWQEHQAQAGLDLRGIAHRAGVLVAVGMNGAILHSENGKTWQSTNAGIADNLNAITTDRDGFIVAGESHILYSSDGQNWSSEQIDGGMSFRAVSYSGSSRIVVGDQGRIWQSSCEECVPAAIHAQPQNTLTTQGGNVLVSVTAGGDGPISYQWRHNGVDIPNATQATYRIQGFDMEIHGGDYQCMVTNSCGFDLSETVYVDVRGVQGVILEQSQSQVICEGDLLSLDIITRGGYVSGYNVKWHKDGTEIQSSHLSEYKLENVSALAAGTYTAEYHDIFSQPIQVDFQDPPEFVSQPESVTVCLGETVVFSATLNNPEQMTLQWFKEGNPMPGQTASILRLEDVSEDDAASYQCRVFNRCGYAGSLIVDLDLSPNPAVSEVTPALTGQGVDPLTFYSEVGCMMGNVSREWRNLTTGEVLATDEETLTLAQPVFEPTTLQLTVTDLADGSVDTALVHILVPAHPDFMDINGDGCNTLADLWEVAANWRDTDQLSPSGDNRFDIIDLLYINISSDPETCSP